MSTKRLCVFLVLSLVVGCSWGGGNRPSDELDVSQDAQDAIEAAEVPDTGEKEGPQEGEVADAVDPDAWDWALPKADAVYVNTDNPRAVKDEPYMEDYRAFIDTNVGECNSIAISGEEVAVGTDRGLFIKEKTEGAFKQVQNVTGPVKRVVANPFGEGFCYVKEAQGVATIYCGEKEHQVAGLESVATGKGGIWYAVQGEVWLWDGDRSEKHWETGATIKELAVAGDGTLVAATSKGLAVLSDSGGKGVEIPDAPGKDVLSVAAGSGKVAVGLDEGLAIWDVKQDKWTSLKTGIGGLPGEGLHAVDMNSEGVVVAYEYGAGAINQGHFDYYVSHRWLPDNDVRDVALDSKGADTQK